MSALGAIITQAIVHQRPRQIPPEAIAFVLVPIVRRRDGNGLALFRYYYQRYRRIETRPPAVQNELGIHVCGGRGQHSRKTPDEIRLLGERVGFDAGKLRATA
jgi:hypothetical protein